MVFGAAGAGCSFLVAAASLVMALAFFFAAFLPADFNFLLRMAFFVVALRFRGMSIPLVRQAAWRGS